MPILPRLSAALATLVALTTAPVPATAKLFDAQTMTLANGMQVVLIENHVAPVVTHMVWYKVGAADEAPGESGIAHFLEHLMFKGTKEVPGGQFSEIVARNGGRENAFTSWDYTSFFQTIASDRLELVMKLEADRMTGLALTDEVVNPERDVVLEERRTRTENDPASILSEQARAVLFYSHPYGTPIIGWPDEIKALGRPQAEAFYKRWYAPNNAVLVVAGDISMDALKPLAERIYGAIPAKPVPARARVAEPPQAAARSIALEDVRVRQPRWQRTYLAPSLNRGLTGAGKEHGYALQVLAEALGGGTTSILYKRLVVERKLAANAGAWYDSDRFDLGEFGLYASPRPPEPASKLAPATQAAGALAAIASATDAILAEVAARGIPEADVERAKQRMVDAAVFARDGLFPSARELGSALTAGATVEQVEAWPEAIAKVTAAEVAAAARAVLRRERSVTSALLPKPAG